MGERLWEVPEVAAGVDIENAGYRPKKVRPRCAGPLRTRTLQRLPHRPATDGCCPECGRDGEAGETDDGLSGKEGSFLIWIPADPVAALATAVRRAQRLVRR